MGNDQDVFDKMLEIYRVWDFVSREKAKLMLQRLYFEKFNYLEDVEDQRLIIHNLTTVTIQIENKKETKYRDMTQAKHYAKATKELLDNCPNYLNNQENKERYCRALNNYTECFKNELTKKQLEEFYRFHYETYKHYKYDKKCIDEYREKLISEYNLNIFFNNFTQVLNVVKDLVIHNNDSQYEEAIQAILQEVKDINVMLYQQIESMIQENNIQAM